MRFKSFVGNLAYLSNMYPCMITITRQGIEYSTPCAESLYQAAKASDTNDFARIVVLEGYAAKQAGKRVHMRTTFNGFTTMLHTVYAKFSQNPALAARLIIEPKTNLVEHNTWNDTYWGVCNGIGKNNLGRILSNVQDYLKGDITKETLFQLKEA